MIWRQSPEFSSPKQSRSNAKALRVALTEPELKLWKHLKHRVPLTGTHFRRQVVIGSYIADFACLSAKLIIEIDGEQHCEDKRKAYDERRTAYMAAQGFRVLRFCNRDVMTEIGVVLETIHAALRNADVVGND